MSAGKEKWEVWGSFEFSAVFRPDTTPAGTLLGMISWSDRRCHGATAGPWLLGRARLLAIVGLLVAGVSTAIAADGPRGFRALAPGVLTVIPADASLDDAIQRGPLVEVTNGQQSLAWVPKRAAPNTTFVELARRLEYPRDIWCLEFAFKPPRQIDVDIPAGDDRMRRATVWYLVYRVKNVGGRRLVIGKNDEGEPDPAQRAVETFEKPVRFLPHFVLESREGLADDEGLSSYRGYLDRLVPSAMNAIRLREDPSRQFLDSAAMAASDIPPGEERWGVAIWEAVDPRIDYFSIYVRGLTNAIRWRLRSGSPIGPDDPPGQHIEQTLESLRLDFWRPGDAAGKEAISIGYRGMFERMALGGRVLAALSWPGRITAQPVMGLKQLKLGWDAAGLVEPAGEGPGTSLKPLETVFAGLAALADPTARSQAARDLFGDAGVESIEALARAAAGPVDVELDAARRRALEPLGLTPEAVAAKPLDSLAKVARGLDAAPDLAARKASAVAIFGAAAPRLDWLRRAVEIARTLAAIEATEADPATMARLDARDAFEAIATAVGAAPADQRDKLVAAMFGPQGPDLFREALAVNEGIDHSWVFRYEN
jgi:hypothetical protein